MSDGPVTRSDLFDAIESLKEDCLPPTPSFVGGPVLLEPSSSADRDSVIFHGPVHCVGCGGGLLGLRSSSGSTRWYPLSQFAWIESAAD